MTVCQATPSSAATWETGRASRPTCMFAHNPARRVRPQRSAAIASLRSVHDPTGHSGSRQRHRRFTHTSRTGVPNAGRSTSATRSCSFSCARTPQRPQATSSSVVSTTTCRRPSRPRATSNTPEPAPVPPAAPASAYGPTPREPPPRPGLRHPEQWSRPPPRTRMGALQPSSSSRTSHHHTPLKREAPLIQEVTVCR